MFHVHLFVLQYWAYGLDHPTNVNNGIYSVSFKNLPYYVALTGVE